MTQSCSISSLGRLLFLHDHIISWSRDTGFHGNNNDYHLIQWKYSYWLTAHIFRCCHEKIHSILNCLHILHYFPGSHWMGLVSKMHMLAPRKNYWSRPSSQCLFGTKYLVKCFNSYHHWKGRDAHLIWSKKLNVTVLAKLHLFLVYVKADIALNDSQKGLMPFLSVSLPQLQ